MNCSIFDHKTRVTICFENNKPFENNKLTGNALQNPDISRLTVNALVRRKARATTGFSRGFWSRFRSQPASANTNEVAV